MGGSYFIITFYNAPSFGALSICMGFVGGSHFHSGGSLGVPFSDQGAAQGLDLVPFEKESEKLWMAKQLCLLREIGKKRNQVVFEDMDFSLSRIKASFIGSLTTWAGCYDVGKCSFASLLLCILSFISWVVRLTAFFVQAWLSLVYPLYTLVCFSSPFLISDCS